MHHIILHRDNAEQDKISSPICDYLCSVIVCVPLQISGAVKQESSNIGMVLAQECAMAVAAVTGGPIFGSSLSRSGFFILTITKEQMFT